MYCSQGIERIASKEHKCTYCGGNILVREHYITWASLDGSYWFTSKMHHECFDDFQHWDEREYTPFINDRPEVLYE